MVFEQGIQDMKALSKTANPTQLRVLFDVIYFSDGVSEGQYHRVLEWAVQDMKALVKTANPDPEPEPSHTVRCHLL